MAKKKKTNPKARMKKLFKEFMELKEEEKVVKDKIDGIKDEVKRFIKKSDGFILCDTETGEGFRKTTRRPEVPDEEAMRESMEKSEWMAVSSRTFDPVKAERAIKKGKIAAKRLKKFYKFGTPSVSVQRGVE